MKKIIFAIACLLVSISSMAGDCLKITQPAVVKEGLVENDWEEYFTIELENEVADAYAGVQFDLYLPKGMKLIEDGAVDLEQDRFDGTVIKKVWTPDADIKVFDKGDHYTIVVLDPKNDGYIHGTSGVIMYLYYTTEAGFKGGVQNASLKSQILIIDGDHKVKLDDITADIVTPVKQVKADGAVVARKIAKDNKIVIVTEDGTEVGVDAIVK